MATAEDVTNELLGKNEPPGHHDLVVYKGSGAEQTIRTLQSKATFAADEATKFLPQRTLADLKSREVKADSVLGHAINAASYGRIINAKLDLIAANSGINFSGVK